MKMTRTIPTDKHGAVYYGPKTLADFEAAIRDGDCTAEQAAKDAEAAGYSWIAARLRAMHT